MCYSCDAPAASWTNRRRERVEGLFAVNMVPNGTDHKQPLKRLWPETRSNRSQVGNTVGRYSISDYDFIVSVRG
jgi:hypothetical protein